MPYILVLPDGSVIVSPESGDVLLVPMSGVVVDFAAAAPPAADDDDWFNVVM